MTIVNVGARPSVPKGIQQFTDNDYKRMAQSNFKCTGWQTYSQSPYAQYKKMTEGLNDEDK